MHDEGHAPHDVYQSRSPVQVHVQVVLPDHGCFLDADELPPLVLVPGVVY